MLTLLASLLFSYHVSWVPPTERTDGEPLTNLAGYLVYYRIACNSSNYETVIVADAGATEVVIPVELASYCWTVVAYDTNDLLSAESNEKVFHSPATISLDTDGDTVPDYADNCTLLSNIEQTDSDVDGYGNRCDGDFNGNNYVNSQDYVLFRQQLGLPSVAPIYNPMDLNSNGVVNAQDVTIFRSLLGSPAGPAGLLP